MKKSTRAVILSLFVFPGAGLWVLGEKKRALIFMVPTFIALVALVAKIMEIAQREVQKMFDSLTMDLLQLFSRVHHQIYTDPGIWKILWFLLAAVILSSVTGYFVGIKKEQEKA
jgi:CDP-diglyceride synthetase